MYAREIGGTTYEFGVSGKLIMNGLVMYDRQTDTFWSQVTSEAVQGPLAGTRLKAIAATQTTWEAWRTVNPDTVVLDKRGGFRSDNYASYYLSGRRGVLGSENNDSRLAPKDLVIGYQDEFGAIAYSFETLERKGVVNDLFGDTFVLAVFEPRSGTGLLFDRDVNEQLLTFDTIDSPEGLRLRDAQTATTWDGFTGEGLSGPLAGTTLERLPTTYAFWFGWSDHFPKTELYGGSVLPRR